MRISIILILLLVLAGCSKPTPPSQNISTTTMTGTIKTGKDLGIDYCKEGLYLQTSDDKTLLLREEVGESREMINDSSFVGKSVEVTGQYPIQEVFCQATLCECDDYMLVSSISPQ